MALHPLRLRRTLTTLTTLHRNLSVPNPKVPSITAPIPNSNSDLAPPTSLSILRSRWFRSLGSPLSSPRQYKLYKEGDEITEATVLFEGCDYNHWLIVVDFPKDNKPPPEEMVRTYENICAQGLGVSVEEAKKRIYACSTSTYEGFQVLMSEEESEKFNDVPGVVFVLPDSYIDAVNKEYGGDKYENGVITERRPPPIQHGRNQGGRFRTNHQPQQNYRQQPPMNNRDYSPRESNPSYQGNYNQVGQGNYNSGQRRDFFQGEQRTYMPPEQRGFTGDHRNYAPLKGVNNGQGPNPGYGQNYDQRDFRGDHRNYAPSQGWNNGQGPNPGYGQNFEQRDFRGDHSNYIPSQGGNYRQGPNPGYGQNFEQRANNNYGENPGRRANPVYGQNYEQRGNPAYEQSFRQGSNPGPGQFGQSSGDGQNYPEHGAGQGFSHGEQGNDQGGMQRGR